MLEYLLLRGVSGMVRYLPNVLALTVGWFVARFGFHILRWRRREAERRIREVFGGTRSAAEVRSIAWVSLRNLCFNAVEMLRAPTRSAGWYDRFTPDAAREASRLKQQAEDGPGAIIAIAHYGNWDLAAYAMQVHGVPMMGIMRSQKNELVSEYLHRKREELGGTLIDRDDPALVRRVLRHLKSGGVVGMLVDLRARERGYQVPFLNGTAEVGRGLGLIARQSKAPVMIGIARRSGWSNHEFRMDGPLTVDRTEDKDADGGAITAAVMRLLGESILSEPHQYFWYNKRWVLEPLAAGINVRPERADPSASAT